MINLLYNGSQSETSVSAAIISISLILMAGFLMTRITKKLRLPNVTAYIVAGILIGPHCLNIVPKSIINGTSFLSDIALAFIAFSTGQFFKFDILKKNGVKVICIALFEALFASVLVFILTFFILRLNPAFSIVLAALASTTAPASIMMTIRQTGAKGDFVETLLQVIAIDNILSLLAYSVAISIALNSFSGQAFSISKIFTPVLINLAVLLLGVIFGIILKLMIQPKTRSSDNRLIISISLLFAFCGICTIFEISPLLGCMSMGTVYLNLSADEKLFKQLNYFSPPFLLMFFVRSGMTFNIPALVNSNSTIGEFSLLFIGILYFITRIIGKYVGAFLGAVLTKKNKETRTYLGLALVPQAGVAIGLAALGARTLKGEVGNALETIILASSVLYELIGPACAKLSLYLSKSYSNKLEDIVEVNEQTPDGKEKSQLELLIDRIQKIQTELPVHSINEDEEAFTEAAEQQNIGFWGEIQKQNLKETVRKRRKK